MKKQSTKTISLILSALMILSVIPMNAYAADGEVGKAVKVKELVTERSLYSKTYRTSENTNVVIASATPMHYEKDNELVEIDNTLVKSKDNSSVLTNKSNSYSVELPKKYTDNSEICLKYGTSELAFRLIDSDVKATKGSITKNTEEEEYDISDAEEVAYHESNIEKMSSSVVYEDLFCGADIEYIVETDSLKENIVLTDVPDESFKVAYELECADLEAKANKDGSVSFLDNKGKEIFLINSPYMFDSKEYESTDIAVSLDKQDERYILTYSPNYKWLTDESTSYPVTIDPTITITGNNSLNKAYIEDTYVGTRISSNKSSATTLSVQSGASTTYWTYFNINHLPSLPENAKINNIKLNLRTTNNVTSATQLGLYYLNNVTSDSYVSTVVYNTAYDVSTTDKFIDTTLVSNTSSLFSFDLTNIADVLYNNSTNNIMLKAIDGSALVKLASAEYATSGSRPYLSVKYELLNGISDKLNYHTQDNGLAGTAYVNDYTGELTVERNDFRSENDDGITFYMGTGVNSPENSCLGENTSINYYQTLEPSPFDDSDYYITFADGHVKYYSLSDSSHDITDDNNGTITIGCCQDDDYVLKTFTEDNDVYYLTSISETKNKNLASYEDENTHETVYPNAHETTIEYDDGYIASVENDIAFYQFEYFDDYYIISRYSNISDDYISTSCDLDYRYNRYSYIDSENTVSIILGADGYDEVDYDAPSSAYGTETISYIFDNNENISTIFNENSLYYSYEYNSTTGEVIQVKEHSTNLSDYTYDDLEGNSISFTYGADYTIISDGTNTYTEFFNLDGQLQSVIDQDGNAIFADYSDGLITKISETRNSARNISNFYGFESNSDTFFNTNSGNVNVTTTEKFNGISSVKLTAPAWSNVNFNNNVTGLKEDTTYTVSMWIKKNASTNCALRLENGDLTGTYTTVNTQSTNDWQHISCTIDTENSTYIKIRIVVDNELSSDSVDVYVDNMYVQQSPYLTNVNLLPNGDFSSSTGGWTVTSGAATVVQEAGSIATTDTNRLKLTGSYNNNNTASQSISINATEGTKYSFGAWIKAENALPDRTDRSLNITLTATGNNISQTVSRAYSTYYSNWQYIEDEITLDSDDYTQLELAINFNNQAGYAYIDGVSLAKEELYTIEFEYEGNAIVGLTTGETVISLDDSEDDNNTETNYQYDSYGNIIEVDEYTVLGENPSPNEIAKKMISEFEYSNNGSLLTKSVASFGNYTDYLYDRFGNTSYVNDANGNIVEYEFDNFQNVAAIIKEFNSTDITDDPQKYNTLLGGNLTISNNRDTLSVKYTYSGDRLDMIETGNIASDIFTAFNTYSFDYDEWNNLVGIYINDLNNPFIEYVYDSDNYRQLNSVVYKNGQQINYVYDDEGNIIYEYDSNDTDGETLSYSYYYYDDGTCYGKKDNIAETIETYQDGLTTVFDYDGNVIHAYGYDVDNNLLQKINNNYVETTVANNQQTTSVNGCESYISRTYDEFGRVSTETIQNENSDNKIVKEYSYYANGDSKTETPTSSNYNDGYVETSNAIRYISYYLVDENDNRTQLNQYRNLYYLNENIASTNTLSSWGSNPESLDNAMFYTYNSADMLIKSEPLVAGKQFDYEYNEHGNIASYIRKTYTGTNILNRTLTSTQQVDFYYDVDNYGTSLKNCLTLVHNTSTNGGSKFHYDSMGNVDSIDSVTYTNGINSYTVSDGFDLNWVRGNVLDSIEYYNSEVLSYQYDDNNLRTHKDFNLTGYETSSIDYIWENDRLVGESAEINNTASSSTVKGKYNSVILYDEDNSAYGFVLNQTEDASGNSVNISNTYYYIKDSLGTIKFITDEDGTIVLTYTYDDYGQPSANYASAYRFLELLNPLVYRDYIFDNDLGMYYLQSRYFLPEIGRFISADTVLDTNSGTPLSTNIYAYCENNPINNSDPTGMFSVSRTSLSIALDIFIDIAAPQFAGTMDVVGKSLKALFGGTKSYASVAKVISKLKTGVVPKFKGLFSKYFTTIRTGIWRFSGYYISTKLKSDVLNFIAKFINFLVSSKYADQINIILCLFSVGGWIALIIDLTDGDFNGKCKLW